MDGFRPMYIIFPLRTLFIVSYRFCCCSSLESLIPFWLLFVTPFIIQPLGVHRLSPQKSDYSSPSHCQLPIELQSSLVFWASPHPCCNWLAWSCVGAVQVTTVISLWVQHPYHDQKIAFHSTICPSFFILFAHSFIIFLESCGGLLILTFYLRLSTHNYLSLAFWSVIYLSMNH